MRIIESKPKESIVVELDVDDGENIVTRLNVLITDVEGQVLGGSGSQKEDWCLGNLEMLH